MLHSHFVIVVDGTRRQDFLPVYVSHRRFEFINVVISFVIEKKYAKDSGLKEYLSAFLFALKLSSQH